MTSPEAGTTGVEDQDTDRDDDERWQRFATETTDPEDTEPEAPPRRVTRWAGHAARILRHEWTLAALGSLALAVFMTWPAAADPAHTIPQDLGDPLLITYVLAWTGHALWNDPSGIWDTSSFWPAVDSYAFTDTFLGYAPAALIGSGHEAALIRYNVLFILAFALAFLGCYALLRQLGARVAGSVVGAAAFAYAPWKLAQAGHLQVLSVGGIVLALAMLARGHGWSLRYGYRRNRTRWGWVLGGWLVAAWQVSIGFGMGVPFAYLLAGIGIVAVVCWAVSGFPRVPWRIVAADAGGGLVFAAVGLLLAIPYFRVIEAHPEAVRTLDYVDVFSPTWSSFLIAPGESALWGEAHAPARAEMVAPVETSLLVGFTLLSLAVVGLVWSVWTRRQRWYLAAGTFVSVALAMGTNFIDDGTWAYALLFEYLPGFDGLRTPGRLVLYTTILLAILAAGTLTHLADRLDGYANEDRVDPRWTVTAPVPLRLAVLLPVLLVLAEGMGVGKTARPEPPPVALSELADPILVLPSDGWNDTTVQYWSVDGFPQITNGTAAFTPTSQQEIRDDALSFPAPLSVAALREQGIRTVVIVRDRVDGTPWQNALNTATQDPTVTVTDLGAVVVFAL
ncbi:hypothetical protein LX16_2331 [Stackebrandtia albiflava]|uniref:4-amino-4-deoxy-L-arabinose transferase-like glycosyltransferase n=1 Tax=Stackebrandtia albiflava TaxID=406432 RepID=A0A562V182_9ACTN|nr:hypothetical protein [Stackebrandtia albiflava]TWJ11605.1 hypothetical protein LX16_2331 [Stackebrandtia albiflava]